MKIYTVEFAPRTESQLLAIPKAIRKLILDRIEKLKEHPRPEKNLYKVPIKDYLELGKVIIV